MPRFGIKAQVMILCVGLLSIPLLGISYWQEIQKTALTAQARIQEIEAKAIATSLLATQQNIGELLAADEDSELEKHSLSAPTIQQPIRLDGKFGDWPTLAGQARRFNLNYPIWLAEPDEQNETAFSLRLAQSSQHLYAAIDVRDDKLVYRQANHLRLDYNEQIQLTYHDNKGQLRRIVMPAEQEGPLASYFTDDQWQYGRDLVNAKTGAITLSHKTGIQGYWRKTNMGYAVELRMSTDVINPLQPQIRIAIVDVDDNPTFGPSAIVASLPKSFEDKLNPVGLHARELQRVIDQLKHTYARLWVYDSRGREWAFAEREPQSGVTPTAFDSKCVRDALNSGQDPSDTDINEMSELKRLVVCYPIIQDQKRLGVVVIEESAQHVLKKEEERVMAIAMRLGGIIVTLLVLLFVYAFTLVRRISKLSEESRKSVDAEGRIEHTTINSSKNFPDEIGDLSRTISTLLQKQQSYVNFLERIPQTLRHEIANPLNKLRTSLEVLLDDKPELADNNYIRKIDAGIDQIGRITLHLTEAASLESAMREEQLVRLDLSQFLNGYLSNWSSEIEIIEWDQEPAWVMADSSRLEQLFDKLLDNACSFCANDGRVIVRVERSTQHIQVLVENDGPLLPTENTRELFSPMVSTRSSGSSIHLGLGLHIAKLISEQHKAKLSGTNREDGSGVVFCLEFSLSR